MTVEHATGDRVVIVRGLLSGVEARVLRRTRFGFYLIELDSAAPRWAAIRRTRAAGWALAPIDDGGSPPAPPSVLHRRRRIAFVDLTVVLVLVPFLLRVWSIVPPLAIVLATATVVGLAALHSVDRADRRPAPSSG